jgi:hypothetical protein
MLSTLKPINTHPTLQQRQGAYHIADIPSKNLGKDLIKIFEVHPNNPDFQNDVKELGKLHQPALDLGNAGCSVSSAFTAASCSLQWMAQQVSSSTILPEPEDFGEEKRFLFALKDSKLAGFINTSTFFSPESRLCVIHVLGSYLPKVGRSLLSLIAEKEKNSQFVANQMSDEMTSHVMRDGKLRKLPPLNKYYKQLGAVPFRPSGMDGLEENPTRMLAADKIQELSLQYLKTLTIHPDPKSIPLNISGLYT